MGAPNRHVTVKSQNASLLNRVADDRGNQIWADEPIDKGGSGKGLTPFELIGAGLGACTSMTLILYARRRKIDLLDVTPRGTIAWAAFMQRTGTIKNAPASWKELFFPEVHDLQGS